MFNSLQNISAPLAGERLQPLGHLSGTVYGAESGLFQAKSRESKKTHIAVKRREQTRNDAYMLCRSRAVCSPAVLTTHFIFYPSLVVEKMKLAPLTTEAGA